ncbi:MAG: hypothetical protein E7567_04055 [Ruminococcaceae bacterium]|nr:hypothetical protein [Oscillospiraceae bacterium]
MYMTRKEIYDHIWTRTVQGFADDYRLNYPILLRRIKEAGIPRPSRKEILFIRQGEDGLRAIHRPELPGDPDEEVKLTRRRDAEPLVEMGSTSPKKQRPGKNAETASPEEPEEEEPVPEEAPALIDYENHPRWSSLYFLTQAERRRVIRETEVITIRTGTPLHPKVLEFQKEIAAWQAQVDILGNEEIVNAVLNKPHLVDRVSMENIERVLSILDSLYASVELLGGSVLEDGSIALHEQIVALRFTESRARVPVEPSVHDEVLGEGGKKWTMQFTGKLTLSVGYLYSIRDRRKDRIEDRLGDALELLFLTAFQLSQNRAGDGERQELGSFNRELERTEELVQQARDYEDAQRIRTLLKAVQKKLSTGELEYRDYFPTWAAWASEKAEWLDPTVGHRDAVLGRRHDPILQPPKTNP